MGDLLIRNIPDALKVEIAKAAAQEGTSLSSEAIDIPPRRPVGPAQDRQDRRQIGVGRSSTYPLR